MKGDVCFLCLNKNSDLQISDQDTISQVLIQYPWTGWVWYQFLQEQDMILSVLRISSSDDMVGESHYVSNFAILLNFRRHEEYFLQCKLKMSFSLCFFFLAFHTLLHLVIQYFFSLMFLRSVSLQKAEKLQSQQRLKFYFSYILFKILWVRICKPAEIQNVDFCIHSNSVVQLYLTCKCLWDKLLREILFSPELENWQYLVFTWSSCACLLSFVCF